VVRAAFAEPAVAAMPAAARAVAERMVKERERVRTRAP
jgi:hypothetical protein